jgi:hypothetical protein
MNTIIESLLVYRLEDLLSSEGEEEEEEEANTY